MKKLIVHIIFTLFSAVNLFALPKLSSLPTAQATIFLDFDGEYVASTIWNGGNPLNCAVSGMNDNQVKEIFNRVSEDYRPFTVNVTTDSAIFLAAPLARRIRIIVTTTSSWYQGVGGVAFLGSFIWGDDTPAFVFTDRLGPFNPKIVAEACSHESGHTVGLSHQSKYDGNCTLTATYNEGNGSGETGWAPIMGNSYYKNHTGWSNGPTPGGCNSLQDNLTIITSKNGIAYRPDDYSNTADDTSTPLVIANRGFSASGIISTTGDKDVFQLNIPQTGQIKFSALPFSVGTNDDGANLDIKITLLDSLMQPVSIYNRAELLNVAFDTTLHSGRYFLVVDGTGNNFSTDYGSLGSYTITGTFTPFIILPVKNVALTGKAADNKHNLTWNILPVERTKSADIESSYDGIHFKKLTSVSSGTAKFSYHPFITAEIFYRLRIISVTNETAYSNVIVLRSGGNSTKSFTIPTMVHDEILLNASKNYTYLLSDISGKIIAEGNGNAGIKTININNNPNGIYIIRIFSQNEKLTERIVRQ